MTNSVNEINDRLDNYTASANFVDLPTEDIYADESLIPTISVEGILRNTWYDIAYAPELDLCVACSDNPGGGSVGTTMYSKNLAQWTHAGPNASGHVNTRCDTVCYSNELRMFVGASTQDAGIGYSFDGVKFHRAAAPHKGFKAVCWSQELRMFVMVGQEGQYRAAYSYNGVDWTFLDIGQGEIWKAVCWAKELRMFVAVRFDGACIVSRNGIDWTKVSTEMSGLTGNLYNVKWSKSLGKLVSVGLSGQFRGAWSTDAEHWTPIHDSDGFSAANEWVGLCVADELGLMIAVARNGDNRIAYTEDGLRWTPVGIENGVREDIQWRAAVWVKEKQVLACIGYGGSAYPATVGAASPRQIMFSFDGKNYFSGGIKTIRGISNKYARHDHTHIDREKGVLSNLLTTDKSNLVGAVNELVGKLNGIKHDGPAVFSPEIPVESMFSGDAAESPAVNPVDETVNLLDGTETRFPVSRMGVLSSEIAVLGDEPESPSTVPIGETVTATSETTGVTPLIHLQQSHEPITASDMISPSLSGEKFMEQQTIQGEIEVVVEDSGGGVKSRQKVTNAITDAFLRYALYDMLNGGTLSSVLRSNTRTGYNLLSRAVPSALGIYAMDRDIDVRSETFLPPYVCGDLNTLDPNVTFFNVVDKKDT